MLLVVPGSVPLTVVVALTRLEGSSARVWVGACAVVVLVTVVRGALPRVELERQEGRMSTKLLSIRLAWPGSRQRTTRSPGAHVGLFCLDTRSFSQAGAQ